MDKGTTLKQGIATYGSREEEPVNKIATSSAATFSEKWMNKKNTTPKFFALPTSLHRPLPMVHRLNVRWLKGEIRLLVV